MTIGRAKVRGKVWQAREGDKRDLPKTPNQRMGSSQFPFSRNNDIGPTSPVYVRGTEVDNSLNKLDDSTPSAFPSHFA